MAKILFVVTGADTGRWPTGPSTRPASGPRRPWCPSRRSRRPATRSSWRRPGGVVPPVDQGSLAADANGGEEKPPRVKADARGDLRARAPRSRSTTVDLDDYAVVFYPGGHGPMEDLAVDPTSGDLLTGPWPPASRWASSATRRPRCWPPSRPRAVRRSPATGSPASPTPRRPRPDSPTRRRGCCRTGSSRGADFQEGEPWRQHVVVDRNLFTGQNPASSGPLADELLAKLS